jgi:Tfp pilus assembly protein FimT
MEKTVVKASMQICATRMPIKAKWAARPKRSAAVIKSPVSHAFVLAEMVLVIFIIGLFVSIAMVNVMSVLGRNTFKSQVNDLMSAMQMAAAKAAESSRRYEIIIDFSTQSYTFREITSGDLSADVLQDEIILQRAFGNDVHLKYIQFDDGEVAAENQAKFRAGRAGWQYGGKIVFVDENNMDYTVMVNRFDKTVQLLTGDVELLAPREDLVF